MAAYHLNAAVEVRPLSNLCCVDSLDLDLNEAVALVDLEDLVVESVGARPGGRVVASVICLGLVLKKSQ